MEHIQHLLYKHIVLDIRHDAFVPKLEQFVKWWLSIGQIQPFNHFL